MSYELDKRDYTEPMCPFDRNFHKDVEANKPTQRINVREMISQVDRLYSRNDKEAAIRVLEQYKAQAEGYKDYDGELAVISELLGAYRISRLREKGIAAADRCFELMKKTGIGGSMSAGTILINCATMLSSFGEVDKALVCYKDACRCYSNHLPGEDTGFAVLYNNMASVYEQLEDYDNAVKYYKTAVNILALHKDKNENLLDMAVTYINLAQIYMITEKHEQAEENVKLAEDILDDPNTVRDYYYAHTAEKLAGGFGFLGYFMKESELKERANTIYEGN